jgi:hypothetical protein
MKIEGRVIILFPLLILLYSCSEIFEEDIEKEEIYVLSPFDGFISNSGEVLFWWDPLDGASAYELQIVSPNFDSIIGLIADTIIVENKISFDFDVGQYEWSLRALNYAYSSAYIFGRFEVSNSEGIQKPKLLQPLQNSVITILPRLFEWQRNAQNVVGDSIYIFDASSDQLLAGYPVYSTQTSLQIGGLEDGLYFWAVRSVDNVGRVSDLQSSDKIRFEIKLQ